MKPVKEVRRERLTALRDEAGGVTALAKLLNKSQSQVSQWLNASPDSKTGKPRAMDDNSAREIEKATGKPAGWMDHPLGETDIPAFSRSETSRPNQPGKLLGFFSRKGRAVANTELGPEIQGVVPLISWIQAGTFAQAVDNYAPGDYEEAIPTSVPIHQHTYALRVKGDSMRNPTGDPSFPEGLVIIVEPDAITDIQELVGKLVIWKRPDDDEATFKRLVRDGGEYLLMPLNPQFPAMKVQPGDVCCGVVRSREQRFF